jgi:hypothetical protein
MTTLAVTASTPTSKSTSSKASTDCDDTITTSSNTTAASDVDQAKFEADKRSIYK